MHEFHFSSAQLPVGRPAYDFLDTSRASFRHLTDHMAELPKDENLACLRRLDTLCRIPSQTGPALVDAAGYVGPVAAGHAITCVLPSEFHAVVAYS